MFNKERFHNSLALSLGYERIIHDKRISIEVEESDDPWVTLKKQGYPEVIRFKASDRKNEIELNTMSEIQNEIKHIIDAVHQAYVEGMRDSLSCYIK